MIIMKASDLVAFHRKPMYLVLWQMVCCILVQLRVGSAALQFSGQCCMSSGTEVVVCVLQASREVSQASK